MKRILNTKTLFGFIFVTMVLSTVYVGVRIIVAPTVADPGEIGVRVKGDYTLMLIQCIAGTLALLFPSFIAHRFKIVIPSGMIVVYAIFLHCGVYLGEVRSFYFNVPHWDTILHAFSSVMLSALGFALINFVNNTDRFPINLSPLFVAMFSFCFAVALGAGWEIYEFSIDYFFQTNMQKFMLQDGTQLVGQAALMDTMKDIIVDCIGALLFSVFGYISLKRKSSLPDRLILKRADKTSCIH